MARFRSGRRHGRLTVMLGDANGLIRSGASEWVWVRPQNATSGDPPVLAFLPKAAVSPDPAQPDDRLMPVVDTILLATPFGSAGAGRGLLRIDVSSLPAGTTRTV